MEHETGKGLTMQAVGDGRVGKRGEKGREVEDPCGRKRKALLRDTGEGRAWGMRGLANPTASTHHPLGCS